VVEPAPRSPDAATGRLAQLGLRGARRVVVAVVGSTVLLSGLAMLLLPGPGLVVIPIGLAILSTEFVWARRWLKRIRERIEGASGSPPDAPPRP
jgi:tellurite resistance protein TerC